MQYEKLTKTTHRLTGDGYREYYKEGEELPYPSCTSVAKLWPDVYGLLKWHADNFNNMEEVKDFLDEASARGTRVHDEIARILAEPNLQWQSEDKMVTSALDYVRDNDLEVISVEQTTFCEEPRFAATIDLLCKHPDKGLGVVDWKSGNIVDNHLLQVAAEAHAVGAEWGTVVSLDKPTKKGYKIRNIKLPRDWRRFAVLIPVWWERYRPEVIND